MIERRITIRHIAVIVAEEFRTPLALMRGHTRPPRIVHARQVAMYLVHHHIGPSSPVIGQWFGGRDHTTVLHAIRTVTEKAEKDSGLADQLKRLGERIDQAETAIRAGTRVLPPEDTEAALPARVVTAPPPAGDEPAARQVLDAVRGYVESRKALRDAEHTRGEFGARRRAEAEYALLDRAWSAYAAGRDSP